MIVEEIRRVAGAANGAEILEAATALIDVVAGLRHASHVLSDRAAAIGALGGKHASALILAVRASGIEAMCQQIELHVSQLRHFETALCPGCRAGGPCELVPKKEMS